MVPASRFRLSGPSTRLGWSGAAVRRLQGSSAQGDASLLFDDWRGETAERPDRLVDAWAGPAARDGTSWIAGFEAPSSAVGITAGNELVAHGWDVAGASGQQLVLDDASLAPSGQFGAMMSWPVRKRRAVTRSVRPAGGRRRVRAGRSHGQWS